MTVGRGALRKGSMVAGCLLVALLTSLAQNAPRKAPADAGGTTRTLMIEKGHALESRGRPDLAIQVWQQVLLSDPNNVEALAGIARDLKLTGSDKAAAALDRLRSVSPTDPNIAKIQALASTRSESDELRHAGELGRQGKVEDAMRIYRQLYGDHPPDGDIALAYYQTLYGTANGKATAIAGMRALADRNPGDPRFAVELGVMLTYDPKTRAEGIRILHEHPKDSNAQTALRQALIWDAANPSSAAELRGYLKEHPQDTQLNSALKEDESKLAQMNSGIARTPAERAAFAALNARQLDEAETRFKAILDQEPTNGRVAAGMGFLRMQQKNFAEAITYLTQAEANGYRERTVQDALATSQFWFTMGEASQAFDQNDFDTASAKYREALAMKPRSPEALNGLAGLLTKQQQYAGAALIYDQLVKVQPNSTDGWRGLFLGYARDNQNDKALAVQARFPASVKVALTHDPEYLRTLATIYQAENRNADAQRVLSQALALPFPNNGTTLKADTRLEYAGILMEAKRYDQAVTLYDQILSEDPSNQSAWIALVSAHHQLGQDTLAIDDVQKMPPAAYEAALSDPGFLTMLGAIYQQANQFEVAQGLLERAVKIQAASGGQPSVALDLQLAGIYLLRNDTQKAYELYHQVLAAAPERADAWKGLIGALQATHRDSEALQEIALIPTSVRKELDTDIEFVQTEASLYAATGDAAHAVDYMNRVQVHYAKLHANPPAAIEIQNAWLLFNTRNDRLLYPALMRLGGRTDMTSAQRETIQDIWANWSVRRAATAMDNGNIQRSVDILDAAAQAFPDNLTVRKAVAGGFVQVGRAKESLALYKTVPMQDASAGDFQGAIGAALAANDKNQAEIWLRQALQRYPRDASILELAARYEQARGDNQRAADYYRASLAAMPSTSPTQKLAHVLVYPDQDNRARRAVTAADLQHLLDPNYEPFPKTNKIPALPAYGADPYNGSAPVVVTPPQALQTPAASYGQDPLGPPPANTQTQQSATPVYVPQSWTRPRTQSASQPMHRTQNPGEDQSPRYASAFYSRPRLVYATLQVNPHDRLRAENVYLRPADFVVRATPPAPHASPRALATAAAQPAPPPLPQAPLQAGVSPQLSANAPHSEASDAWKGLVFSLMASNRNAEALAEINKIPPDVRAQLEADVEFEQGEASLYLSLGDTAQATEYLNRVENFYLLHRGNAPSGLELQHGWLLYNLGNDKELYPVLLSLDTRTDLTAGQRDQLSTLWLNFAVRRASLFLNNGNLLRGVQLLQAASQDYPNNMTVRSAVAGAYSKVGRPADALALFKTIPMQQASSGDFVGAIGAALGAQDMPQAEAWLRLALARFPNDPQILAEAARFEQARGNTARAADFWRASLAAMPPGSAAQRLDTGLVPAGSYTPPQPGDMKRLLDPRNDPAIKTPAATPLPAYISPSSGISNSLSGPQVTTPQQAQPQTYRWSQPASSDPLPLPAESNPATTQPAQGTVPNNAPVYGVPQASNRPKPQPRTHSGSAVVAQSTGQNSAPLPLPSSVPTGAYIHTGNQVQTQTQTASQAPAPNRVHTGTKSKPTTPDNSKYMGKMNVPPSDETIASVAPAQSPRQSPSTPPAWTPGASTGAPNPSPSLRITSQPMGPVAAQAQALFADQIDGQLTQGSASAIHAIPNAPINSSVSTTPSVPGVGPLPSLRTPPLADSSQMNTTQYTPSAQEAATGAYSAPRQQQQQPAQQPESTPLSAPPPPKPSASTHVPRRKRTPKLKDSATPTLEQAPAQAPAQQAAPYPQQVQVPDELPAPTPAPTTDTGLTDQELQQRNLPPLRGPWVRVQREAAPVSPRDEAEMQLRSIESGYSPWMGGAGVINYRSGSLGYDHLAALEATFEASMPLGYNGRLTLVARPVFLDSGAADGTSVITVLESTTAGSSLVTIPQPIGTLTATATTPPAQQNAVGIGGELQLAFPHFAVAGGYTPEGFLVATFTGRAMWKPANGPITLNFSRDPVKDTQLSYAGLRDPSGDNLGSLGQIWGGVVANQGNVQFAHGDEQSGFYFGVGGQYLTGYQVENNTRIDGSGGAYWRLKTMPEYGNLSIGANFFGMHYTHNEDAFTHGMGGYFSPQSYFLANIPFTWVGHVNTHWHYTILGSLGVQAFQENLTPLWPLAVDKALETALNNAMLPAKTSVGPNYDLRSQVSYQISPHWFAGGFLGANNSRNYTSVNAGFSIHYMFRAQPSTATTPTGIFPNDGLRPFTVP